MDGRRELSEAAKQLRAVRGLRWPALLAVMLSGPPMMALTFSTLAPVLPSIADHFGTRSDGALFAQWIMTAPAIGLMCGGPLSGLLINRVDPGWLIRLAFVLFAIAGSAGLWLDDAVMLLVSRFLLGLAGSCVATTATWLIGERFDENSRRRMIGIQDAIAGAAAVSALLLSGIAAAAGGWRLPFAIYLVAIPFVVLAMAGIPNVVVPAQRNGFSGRTAIQSLWPIYAIILAMAGLVMLPATQVPFLLERNGISDPIIRSRIIACSSALAIASAALYSAVRHRLGERGTLAFIMFAYVIGTATLGQSDGIWVAALGCAMLGMGTGLFAPHFASVLIAHAQPATRGHAIGLMYGVIFLGEFLSPSIILPLRSAFGVHGSFSVLSAALSIGLVSLILRRRPGSTPNAVSQYQSTREEI